MKSSNVIDFTSHFKKKRKSEKLREELIVSGWEITDKINLEESEVCVYLMDTKEPCVVLYGTRFDKLPGENDPPAVDWQHFVLAWDVIADPEMPFDETHKRSTIDLSLSMLGGVKDWKVLRNRICAATEEKKPHLLILIDRENMAEPKELIIAYSKSSILNADSLHAILESYIGAE